MILVSPAEPASVKRALDRVAVDELTGERVLWEVDSLPERKGVDFLWRACGRWHGLQRKEVMDLLASLNDGRLRKERGQMASFIDMPHIALEGRINYTTDGLMVTSGWGGTVERQVFWKRLLSLQHAGIAVTRTDNAEQTCQLVVCQYLWSLKAEHTTAGVRPKPPAEWGKRTNSEFIQYVLESVDAIGPKRAKLIIEGLGRLPIKATCSAEELLAIPGIGPGTVKAFLELFEEKEGEVNVP